MRFATVLGAVLLLLACQSQEERLAGHAERSKAFFEAEQWVEAKIATLNLLQIDADDPQANHRLAEIHLRLKEPSEALWRYRESVRLAPDNMDWRLELAEFLILARQFDASREQVESALELNPDSSTAHLLRARLHIVDSEPDAMLAETETAIRLAEAAGEQRTLVEALKWKAQALAFKDDMPAAEAALRRRIELDPTSENNLDLANLLTRLARPDEAKDAFEAAVTAAEDSDVRTASLLTFVSYLIFQEDWEAAESLLTEARSESPENEKLMTSLARLYLRRDRPEEAAKVLEDIATSRPADVAPLLALAQFRRRFGDIDDALGAVRRALVLEPEHERARLTLAEFLMHRSNREGAEADEARKILAAVLEVSPDSPEAMFTEAKFLVLDGDDEEAAHRLRRVTQDMRAPGAHLLLALVYLRTAQTDLARSELLEVLKLDPGQIQARKELARLYLAAGNRELAAQEALAALRAEPDSAALVLLLAQAWIGLERRPEAIRAMDQIDFGAEESATIRLHAATLEATLGRSDRAMALVDSVMEEDPASAPGLRMLVRVHTHMGDPRPALERLNDAISASPDSGELYEIRANLQLGFRERDTGKLLYSDEVEADLKRAVELGPDRGEAHGLLGILRERQGRNGEAPAAYQRAIDASPDKPGGYLLLADVLQKLDRDAAAIAVYEKMLRVMPKNGMAKNNLAWLLANQDAVAPEQLDRAQELAEDAKESLPNDANVTDTLGWVMLKKRIPRAAIPLFRAAADSAQNDSLRATARYHLALAYEQAGESDRAIKELEGILTSGHEFPDRSEAQDVLDRLRAG